MPQPEQAQKAERARLHPKEAASLRSIHYGATVAGVLLAAGMLPGGALEVCQQAVAELDWAKRRLQRDYMRSGERSTSRRGGQRKSTQRSSTATECGDRTSRVAKQESPTSVCLQEY